MGWKDGVPFEHMLGANVQAIEQDRDEELRFVTNRGTYRMYHSQDCCESVVLAEVIGNLADIRGLILQAEEVSHENETPIGATPPEYSDSFTWTFYKLATIKGSVTLRWLGESNGYYSETVDFELLPNTAIDAEFSVVERERLALKDQRP